MNAAKGDTTIWTHFYKSALSILGHTRFLIQSIIVYLAPKYYYNFPQFQSAVSSELSGSGRCGILVSCTEVAWL